MCHQSFMDMYGAKQQHMLHHVVWSVSLFNRFIRMLVEKVLFRIERGNDYVIEYSSYYLLRY